MATASLLPAAFRAKLDDAHPIERVGPVFIRTVPRAAVEALVARGAVVPPARRDRSVPHA